MSVGPICRHGTAWPYRVTTSPESGPSQLSSTARAMAADALPAPTTTVRPLGGGGRAAGMRRAGWAAATAASKTAVSRACGSPAMPPGPAGRGAAYSATGWDANNSSALTIAEWSQALPPWAAQALNSSCALAVFGRLTPSARALASARLRSF